MPEKITKTLGSGITERRTTSTVYQIDTLSDNAPLIEALEQMQNKIKQPWRGKQEWVAKIRARAAELARQAPDENHDPAAYQLYYSAHDTEPWYFRQMAWLTIEIEEAVGSNRSWDAVQAALELGEILTEWRFKSGMELVALAGKKQKDDTSRGGKSRLKYTPEYVKNYVDRLLGSDGPNRARTKSEAVSIAAIKLDLAESTVYNKIRCAKQSALKASIQSDTQ